MKRILCLLLSLMLLTCACAAAQEESLWNFNAGDFVLEGYTGPAGDIVVPGVISDCPVETIGTGVFNDMPGVTSITLPETVRFIRSSAMSFLEDMTNVVLPEGLLFIGDNCFNNCFALTELTIPSSVCYIGDTSFASLSGIASVTFKGVCPRFAGSAFEWLGDSAVIYVPDDQLDAYAAAFEAMEVQADIRPSGVNAEVYEYYTAPALFSFDAETGTITAYNGYDLRVDVPAEIDGVAVKSIGASAFYANPYLLYIALPEGLETIEAGAFEYCSEILYVEFPGTLKTIGDRAFADAFRGTALYFPESLESIGSEAFANAVWVSNIQDLPENLKTIGDRAFSGCGWLTEVYVPASLESIGEEAFADCGVNYVVFEGESLPEIAASAFSGCEYLADIDLHSKATKQDMLSLQAFVDSLGLECRVWRMQNPAVDYIYDGLDVYESGIMTGYTGTQTHIRPWDTFDDFTVTGLGDGVFKGNTTIEYFAVPYNDMFTTIGAEAFADSTVAYIDLFDSVTTIREGAFRNCLNLTEITIPESVTEIAADAFEGCTGLESVTFLCDPAILTEGMLDTCTAVSEVAGPDPEALQLAVFGLPEVTITCQPEDVFAPEGEWAEITVEADGNDLTYAWYVMAPTDVDYLPDASATGNTYGIYVDDSTEFTSAYCVVTDKYGTSVTSNSASFFVDSEEEEELIPVPVSAEGEPYFGAWTCVSMEMDGEELVLADIGMVMDFTFNQDGTADIFDGEYTDTGVWGVTDGMLDFLDGSFGVIGEDGVLEITEGNSKMYLVRGEQSEAPVSGETAASDAAPQAQGMTETKFVCTTADVEGYTLDASMLGGEYSLIFHENGACDFVVVGAAMPPLPWSQAENGNFIIDYYGTMMEVVWTDSGFDMNYFDTMLMHFAPAN